MFFVASGDHSWNFNATITILMSRRAGRGPGPLREALLIS